MSLPFLHSPAVIVQALISSIISPTTVYAGSEPTEPDNCITVYDTEGQADGREMVGGEILEHIGIMFRVRGKDHPTTYSIAANLRKAIAEQIRLNNLVLGSATYTIWCFSKIKPIFFLGRDMARSQRYVFTVNCLASIERVA